MKYAFDTVDLKHLIEDVIAELKPNIDKTGLSFSFAAENNGTDYRTTLNLPADLVKAVDNYWHAEQLRSRNEAIRELLCLALDHKLDAKPARERRP